MSISIQPFSVSKHAILILAHENPKGLLRLLNRLKHKRIQVFIHLDKKNRYRFNQAKLEKNGAMVISTRRVNWAGHSICLAELDLLRAAYKEGPFETYSLISGRDYPLKSIEQIVEELDGLNVNLIDHWHNEDPSWHRRYARLYFYDHICGRMLNAFSRRLAPFFPDRKAPEGINVYFGWMWWTLLESGVESVFRFCEERPDVLKWYRNVHISDESFFQTALKNVSSPPPLSRDVRRYIQFKNGAAHPKTIDFEDLDQMLSGRHWFARKFCEKKVPGLLDTLDSRIKVYS